MIENLDNDHDMAFENEMLREENKRLKMEKNLERLSTHDELREENKKLKLKKEHLRTGLSKFTRHQYLQSELLMNTVMKMDRSGIGFLANQEKKTQAQHQQHKSKPKPKRCFECGRGHFAHECETPPPQPLPKHARPFAFNAYLPRRKWLYLRKMMIKLYSRVLDTTYV